MEELPRLRHSATAGDTTSSQALAESWVCEDTTCGNGRAPREEPAELDRPVRMCHKIPARDGGMWG
eukprot:4298537-Prymnesium_polylepis.1